MRPGENNFSFPLGERGGRGGEGGSPVRYASLFLLAGELIKGGDGRGEAH